VDRLLLRTIAWVALLALVGWTVHLMFGASAGWGAFAGGVVVLLLHHVRHIDALTIWLKSPVPGRVPPGHGAWDYIFSLLYHFERAQTRRNQLLTKTLVRFRQAGRAHPDGVVILDADNRIEWCNDTAESHFDFNLETDAGQPITNLIREPEFVAYVDAGDYTKPMELRSSRSSGAVYSVQIITYGDAQKLLLSRDITLFEKVEVMRRDFVANVSHELRTPLTVLSGFLETILELKLDTSRSRDYIKLMAEQCKRMEGIVSDLLTLSALESAPGPRLTERVGIAALLERVRGDAEMLSGGRHRIAFEVESTADLLGAESEIASAFGNLATNAVRYTPDGGEIHIAWRRAADEAEFSVQDSGIGIAPEHIPRLTERFYRVDRGRSRETGGTGLGLAIVKHVLTRHQATLEIKSEAGRGSRFTARFPSRRVVPATPELAQSAREA
jgi:two-component system, OmpR family, phosphate regulon sensor histidine kinase PhoR